jgi:hypothetical protein
MPSPIKTREIIKDIKVIDKSINVAEHTKTAYIKSKDAAEESQMSRHISPTEYASDTVSRKTKAATSHAAHKSANYIKGSNKNAAKNLGKAKDHFQDVKQLLPKERLKTAEQAKKSAENLKKTATDMQAKAKQAKATADKAKNTLADAKRSLQQTRMSQRHAIKTLKKGVRSGTQADRSVKTSVKSIKTASKSATRAAKLSVKTADKSAKAAAKAAKVSAKASKVAASAAIKSAKVAAKAGALTAKVAIKAVIAMIKAAITAIKGLVALIVAGGWIAILVIVIICLIALLLNSIFGIFFSGEPNPETGQTLNCVLREIDTEFESEIDSIIANNPHDLLDMSGARAAWKHVLAIYTVRTVADPDNHMAVAMMDDARAEILRNIFWDMNTISYIVESYDIVVDVLDDSGNPTGDTEIETITVLRIVVSHLTVDEATALYGFDSERIAWLEELLLPEYHMLWNALLFGITSIGDGSMVEVAITQIGNVGGEIYWRWFGFGSRVPWCAIFVSWVAEQCGFIEAGVIPMFSSTSAGMQWFQSRGQWQPRGFMPSPGDLIFFDWTGSGTPDHVGIVERVEGNTIHTIEGNSSDMVRRRTHQLNGATTLGYGVPLY